MSEEARPSFDPIKAERMIGKSILIGLTYLDSDGAFIEQKQLHGRIVSADSRKGFEVALEGVRAGESYRLPPDPRCFKGARPGEYRLRSTGETVVDPDFECSWTVTKPDAAASP